MTRAIALLNEQVSANPTMGSALCIEVSALVATVVHLASKEAGKNSADDENSSEHNYCQESIGETFHL